MEYETQTVLIASFSSSCFSSTPMHTRDISREQVAKLLTSLKQMSISAWWAEHHSGFFTCHIPDFNHRGWESWLYVFFFPFREFKFKGEPRPKLCIILPNSEGRLITKYNLESELILPAANCFQVVVNCPKYESKQNGVEVLISFFFLLHYWCC